MKVIGKVPRKEDDTVDWKALTYLLWRDHWDRGSRFPRMTRHNIHGVRLSTIAWNEIKEAITSLPVTITNVSFGFTVGLCVWTMKQEPFPDAVTPSRALFVMHPDHMPDAPLTGPTFDWAWENFFPLVDRKVNRELLKRCGLPLPGSKVSYAY